VGVARTVPPSLTRLGDHDLATESGGPADPCPEQGGLCALTSVLGAGPRETQVGHALGRVKGGRAGGLVAVEGEPAQPADVRQASQPRLDRLREAVAQAYHSAERHRVPGRVDLDESKRALDRRRILRLAAEGHPSPPGHEPSGAKPIRQLTRPCARSHGYVKGDPDVDHGERVTIEPLAVLMGDPAASS
jgi:hypothetical protein